MSEVLDSELRGELARTLAAGLRAVTAEYAELIAHGTCDTEPSRFGRRHNAARSALGHLEALLRLQRQLRRGAPGNSDTDEATLLAQARARLGETADEAA